MSRPWQITVKEILQKTVVAEDSVSTRLDLGPQILPREQTQEIMGRILQERGFESSSDGHHTRQGEDGVLVDIDPDGGIRVSAQESEDLDLSQEGNLPNSGCGCAVRAKERLQQGLRDALDQEASQAAQTLQERVTGRLEGALQRLACEMETVANQITSSALKKKAQQLGTIKKITQDIETGSMTILVEV